MAEHIVICDVVMELRRTVVVTVNAVSPAVAKMAAQQQARNLYPATAQRLLPGGTLAIRKVRTSL